MGLLGALAGCGEPPASEVPLRAVLVQSAGTASGAAASQEVITGEVRARHEADLSFRVGGKLLERRVDAGTTVRAGQVLAKLDPRDVQLAAAAAQAAMSAAAAELGLAQADYRRAEDLRAKNYISAAALDARRAALDAAEAKAAQASAQARVADNQAAYATLRADVDGVVTAILAEPGQVLEAGSPVLRVARGVEREVLIHVAESRLRSMVVGTAVEVRPWANPDRHYAGRVRELSPAADPTTRTYAARVSVSDADDSLPLGATAVVMSSNSSRGQLRLPLPAVVRQEGGARVWVVAADGTVVPRPVEVAAFEQDVVLISAGLKPDDLVVVAGAHTLTAGQKVRPVEAGAPVTLDARR
ncbi:MAG: efflux RND transporter periplasmic adaptor subunit [Zoogloeaceae bacterium]|nr:efflux RND transporter periplasmic adaptor subunit [Zoogloeaceae bacterium]